MSSARPPRSPERLELTSAGGRARLLFVCGVTGLALAVTIGVAVADPSDFAWPIFVVLLILVIVVDGLMIRGRTWIQDTDLYQRRVASRHADLRRCVSIELRSNGGDEAQLVVRDDSGACACAGLLTLSPAAARGASPVALHRLATELAHAPAPGADAVGLLLLRQSRHVQTGRPLSSSPLVPFATGRHGRVVNAAALGQLEESGQRHSQE